MTKRKPLRWVDVGGRHAVPDCETCFDFLTQPHMAEAIASVGIETGGVNIRQLLDRYHANRHVEPAS
jgi:hypothetical protein